MYDTLFIFQKIIFIFGFSLITFILGLISYPYYIRFLRTIKAGKKLREDDRSGNNAQIFKKLHAHKIGTPTMGGGLFLMLMISMLIISLLIERLGFTNNSLISQEETYILLFAFFSMGILGFIDDIFNILGKGRVRGLTSRAKILWMFLFSGFITRRFYFKLGIDYINLRPFGGERVIGLRMVPITFIGTVAIVNAVNITDGLDGLAGGLLFFIFAAFSIVTFSKGWYISTALVGVVCAIIMSFLWYNIPPAKVFMGDSGSLALGGLLATLLYLVNIRAGILFPSILLLSIFGLELLSSGLQMISKKFFRRKLFPIAPFHHLLEYYARKEHTIVMRLRLIQFILTVCTLLLFFVQFQDVTRLLGI